MEFVFPSPSLVITVGENQKISTFYPITNGRESVSKKLHLNSNGKEINLLPWLSSYGYLIVWSEDENDISFSLWNPVTTENHEFPVLNLTPEHRINGMLLTEPLGNPDCMLVLFARSEKGPSLIYRLVEDRDEKWTEQFISDDKLTPNTAIQNPVMCNGKIYGFSWGNKLGRMLVEIDIKQDGLLLIDFFKLDRKSQKGGDSSRTYMVESCGELFVIVLSSIESGREFEEVRVVEVFKVGSDGICHVVESFEDRAFFLGLASSGFSCLASEESGIKGNHVYFILANDWTLYAFNMEDGTVLFSKPFPNLPEEPCTRFWFKTNLGNKHNEDLVNEDANDAIEETKSKYDNEDGEISRLSSNLLAGIASRLQLNEYMKFRAVSTTFKSAVPLEGLSGTITSLPLLVSWRLSSDVWSFVDPLSKDDRYLMTHNNKLSDARICSSKGGWCVVIHGKNSVLLWNPFIKKTIDLPALEFRLQIVECSFSSLPDSADSDCVIVLSNSTMIEYSISFIKLGDKEWESLYFKPASNDTFANSYPIFYKEAIYFLDEDGNLGVYELSDREEEDGGGGGNEEQDGEGGDQGINDDAIGDENDADDDDALDRLIKCPYESFHHKFLLECDGQLLSVFVSFLGKTVRVFKLDESQKIWISVTDLGNHTLYLSHISAFSIVAPPGMQNRIYFPRYYGERSSVIYYSLESGKLHSHNTKEILEDFYDSKEKLLCGWIIPTL